MPGSISYGLITLVGITVTALLLRRPALAHGRAPDDRLYAVYGGALAGAYLGAKLAFLLAEGWWFRGDWLALAIGRVGCVLAGCFLGVECDDAWWTVADAHGHARWPAPIAEMAFNLAFLAWAIAALRLGWQRGQRFNVYLMAYGAFRFTHEFVRDDARWVGPFGGYHLVSLAILATGAWMYRARSVANARQPVP